MSTTLSMESSTATEQSFTDFYMRPNLSSNGMVPASNPLCQSPDICPNGNQSLDDFVNVLTNNYSSDPGKDIMQGYDNYIYVRGKNGSTGAVSKQIELYYSPSSVINWPNQWVGNQLLTADSSKYVTVNNIESSGIGVGNQCFIWRAVQPPPSGSDHYCLIGNVNDANNSHPVPGTASPTYEDMSSLVQNDLRFSWRNVKLISSNAPTWTYNELLTIPQNMVGNQAVQIAVTCPASFAGGSIAFSSSNGSYSVGKTTIPQISSGTSFVIGAQKVLSAGFTASIQVNFWQGNASPKSGDSITLSASYQPATEVEYKRALARKLIHPRHEKLWQQFKNNIVGDSITPYTPVLLGAVDYKIK